MTIYLVINDQNKLEYAYFDYEVAVEEVAKLNQGNEESHFSISTINEEDF